MSSEGMILDDLNQPVDQTSYVLRPLRSRLTPEAYYYNRYRAQYAAPVRQALALHYGMPMGGFDPNESSQARADRLSELVRKLLAAGFTLDATTIGGPMTNDQSPLGAMVIRAAQAGAASGVAVPLSQDPEALVPYFDMVITAKPFNWNIGPPDGYLHGITGFDDRDGVGAIYQCNVKDRSDIGARYFDGDKSYEKTTQADRFGSTPCWERFR